MNPIFLQLMIKAKMRVDELKAKKAKTAMSHETETTFPFSVSTFIRLIILFIVLYLIDINGWFIL
jgi:hypothetical protein